MLLDCSHFTICSRSGARCSSIASHGAFRRDHRTKKEIRTSIHIRYSRHRMCRENLATPGLAFHPEQNCNRQGRLTAPLSIPAREDKERSQRVSTGPGDTLGYEAVLKNRRKHFAIDGEAIPGVDGVSEGDVRERADRHLQPAFSGRKRPLSQHVPNQGQFALRSTGLTAKRLNRLSWKGGRVV